MSPDGRRDADAALRILFWAFLISTPLEIVERLGFQLLDHLDSHAALLSSLLALSSISYLGLTLSMLAGLVRWSGALVDAPGPRRLARIALGLLITVAATTPVELVFNARLFTWLSPDSARHLQMGYYHLRFAAFQAGWLLLALSVARIDATVGGSGGIEALLALIGIETGYHIAAGWLRAALPQSVSMLLSIGFTVAGTFLFLRLVLDASRRLRAAADTPPSLPATVGPYRSAATAPPPSWLTLAGWSRATDGLRLYGHAVTARLVVAFAAVATVAFALVRARELVVIVGFLVVVIAIGAAVAALVGLARYAALPVESHARELAVAALTLTLFGTAGEAHIVIATIERAIADGGRGGAPDVTGTVVIVQLLAVAATLCLVASFARTARVFGVESIGTAARAVAALLAASILVVTVGGVAVLAAPYDSAAQGVLIVGGLAGGAMMLTVVFVFLWMIRRLERAMSARLAGV